MTIMAHTWGEYCDEGRVQLSPTPEETDTWKPVNHHKAYTFFRDILTRGGYRISDETHALSKDRLRYLGGFVVEHDDFEDTPDYRFTAAIMNSNNKAFPLKAAFGTNVFVCDNMAWQAEHTFARRHTRNVWEDFQVGCWRISATLPGIHQDLLNNIDSLKNQDFSSRTMVHDCVVESCKQNILPWRDIPHVLDHWNTPEHDEFKPRNGNSLFNAYTSHWRGANPLTLSGRTQKLMSHISKWETPCQSSMPI